MNPSLPPPPNDPAARRLPSLPGYETLQEIGRGGMGIVYKARQISLGRTVAVKVMIAGQDADDESLVRFHREARAAAKLDHPNIVQVLDVGRSGAKHFFAMRHVDGCSLNEWVKQREVTPRIALELTRKVALALDYAHSQGVIHRDVKPANILIDAGGEPHLVDFGLAKDLAIGGLTASGTRLGTPSYAPPEQLDGNFGKVDARADVYSLGATLYYVLTGRAPFDGDRMLTIVTAVLFQDPIPPRAIHSNIHRDVETICLKALEKEPDRRYATVREMADDIGRYLDGEPIRATPAALPTRVWRKARKNLAVVLPAVVAVVFGLAISIGALVQGRARARDIDEGIRAAEDHLREADASSDRRRRREACTRARDALVGVLRLDGANARAKEAIARVDAALAQIAADEDAEREKTSADAALAGTTLRKFQAVSSVLWRWTGLQETLRTLEGIAHDDRRTPEERVEAARDPWKAVQQFIDEAPSDSASQATTIALAAWAQGIAGPREAALAEMRHAADVDAEVPHGVVMEALVLLGDLIEAEPLPSLAWGATGLQVGTEPEETSQAREASRRIDALLAQAVQAAVGGKEAAEQVLLATGALADARGGRLDAAEVSLTRALAAPTLKPIESALRLARARVRAQRADFDGAIGDLAEVAKVRPGEAHVRYLEARVRLQQAAGSKDGAVDLAEGALRDFDACLQRDGSFADGYRTRGIARLLLAERSDADARRRWLTEAIADFDGALRHDERNPQPHCERGLAWLRVGDLDAAGGGDAQSSWEHAVTDLELAVPAFPEAVELLDTRGDVYVRLARVRKDGEACLRQAIADHAQVARRDPARPGARLRLAEERIRLGVLEARAGGDPRGTWADALEDARIAVEADGSAEARLARAEASLATGDWAGAHGEDPAGPFERALLDAEAILERDAEDAAAHRMRAEVYLRQGRREAAAGKDPSALYDKADRAIAQVHGRATAAFLRTRGAVRLSRGKWEAHSRKDASESYEKAQADLEAASAGISDDASLWYDLGRARLAVAGVATYSPATYAKAIEAYDRAVAIDGALAEAYAGRGEAHLEDAERGAPAGQDPDDGCAAAVTDFDLALAKSPGSVEVMEQRARALTRRAFGRHGWGPLVDMPSFATGARGCMEEAVKGYGEAIARRAGDIDLLLGRALAEAGLAIAVKGEQGDPRPWLAKAQRDWEAALAASPGDARVLCERGRAWFWAGVAEVSEAGGPAACFDKARKDGEAAVAKDATMWQADLLVALAWEKLERWDLAVRAYQEAEAAGATGVTDIEDRLKEARNHVQWARLDRRRALGEWALQARAAMRSGEYASARTAYEGILEAAMKPPADEDFSRSTLREAHFDLARVYALWSTGKTSPSAKTEKVTSAEAQARRDRAFEHLSKWADGGVWNEDISKLDDLASLRDDPRWVDVLRQVGGSK